MPPRGAFVRPWGCLSASRAAMAADWGIDGGRGRHARGAAGRSGLSHPLLHVLHARERNALGPLFGIAEIELVLGEIDRVAIDVVGDRGGVGRDEGVQLLTVVGRNPARELKF